MTYLELGQLDKAEPLLEEGRQYTLKAYGEKHPAMANHLASQGRLLVLQRKYKAAEKCYLQALDIFTAVFGPANQRTKSIQQTLGEVYQRMGKPKAAKSYRERLAKIT